jgi:hypothetical protein
MAVMVLGPARNPFAAFTATLFSVARPPPPTAAVPREMPPRENVTFPATVPGVVEVTDAVNEVVPASVTHAGVAVRTVAVTAEPVTVIVVLTVEVPYTALPPYVAVIVFVPVLNPLVALTATLGSVASPPETGAVPNVVLPMVNVTVPAMVPAVVEVTDATSSVVPASVTQAGAAVRVVLVGASTVTGLVPLEGA